MKCLICHEEWDEVEDAVLCCDDAPQVKRPYDTDLFIIEKAHKLVTQWLARPEPPNTGELVALATILEGKQPEDGREDA